MKALAGIGTLLTRPSGQNEALALRIQDLGGHAYVYPLFDIRPLMPNGGKPLRAGQRSQYAGVIFVSPNAVRHGQFLLGRPWPRDVTFYAVGEGTAQVLHEIGVRHVITPARGAGSEPLAKVLELEDVNGRAFLLIRGREGRTWLADTLRTRGATVDELVVYERVEHPDPEKRLVTWLIEGILDVIVVSSEAALTALVGRVGEDDYEAREQLFRLALLSPSRRVLETARRLGFQHDGLLAPAPGDEALLATLVEWWAGSEEEM